MFRRLLVPLDGSLEAEQAIPAAIVIARASGASILLLQVVSVADIALSTAQTPLYTVESTTIAQDAVESEIAGATEYLEAVVSAPELAGLEVEIEVDPNTPAEGIIETALERKADLIVLCSHEHTTLKRWLPGDVADRVARHSPIPVLMLHEGAGVPTTLHPDGQRPVRVLVPLDGSPLAELVLPAAMAVSAALSTPLPGALHLARVVSPAQPQEGDAGQEYERGFEEARGYLAVVAQRLQEGENATPDLTITTSVVADADVVATLIKMAEEGTGMPQEASQGCDVIALSAHEIHGLQRLLTSKVAERLFEGTRVPLLVVRPE